MTGPCSAALHGAEGMSWGGKCAANPGYSGSPVPAKNYKGEWWQAMVAWGQAYIPVEGSSATNTRLQLRNLVTKFLQKDGQWRTMNTSNPGGCSYFENFANNDCIGSGARDESANGGGLSVIVGVGPWAGRNYHFYSDHRESVDVNNLVGVFTSVEARLIVDDAGKPDDRAQCKNILSMGADWWLNTSVGWLPDWSANSGLGGGRNKWVTTEWQTFSFTSQSPSDTRANPPCP